MPTNVLFVTERDVHPDPAYGLTNSTHNLIGSLECSGLTITYEHLFIAPDAIWSQEVVDRLLLTKTYDFAAVSVFHKIPSHAVAAQIGRRMGLLWWDAIKSDSHIRSYTPHCPNFIFDWGKGEEYPNCYAMQVPQDTRIYRPEALPEDLDVGFVGAVDAIRPERGYYIEMLRNAGISVHASGGRGPGYTNWSVQDYASIFNRSKICLNFAQGHGRVQRKGRVFEIAACGRFMMSNNPEAMNGRDGIWFVDGEDYVSFDEGNVVERVRYYLDHEDERQRIAQNMHQKYLAFYGPNHFWSKVFNLCGVAHRSN